MPVSFLDRPAESNIINTYVQAPYQEILQAGLARQSRYDETLNALQANQEYLDQLQAIEGTAQEEYLNQSRQKIASIAEQYANKDLSNSYIRRQLRDEVRRNINPATINTIVQSKKNQELRNKYIMEGKAKNMYYEPYEQLTDPILNKTLGVNQLYDYLPNLMVDPDTYIGETYYKNLEPTVSSSVEGNENIRYTRRSLKDLANAANRNILDFADTTQGKAILAVAQARGDNRPKEEILRDVMAEVAPEYVINNREHQGYVPEYMMRGYEPKTTTVLDDSANTESLPNVNRTPSNEMKKQLGFNPDIVDLKETGLFDTKGNYVGKKVKEYSIEGEEKLTNFLNSIQGWRQKRLDKKTDAIKTVINNVKAYNTGNLDKVSDAEALNRYIGAYKQIEDADYNTYLYETDPSSGHQRDIITDQIKRDLGGRELRISETGAGAGQTQNTLDEIYDKYGVVGDDRDEAFKSITVTSIVPALGGYQASMLIKGQPKNFIISPNKDVQAATDLIYKATQKHLDGTLGEKEITDAKGNKFIVTTVLQPDINGVYEFSSNIRTKDGSPRFPDETGEGLTDAIDLYSYEQLVANSLRYKIR